MIQRACMREWIKGKKQNISEFISDKLNTINSILGKALKIVWFDCP